MCALVEKYGYVYKPVMVKPLETCMDSDKGSLEYWVAVVKPSRIFYEMGGVTENIAGRLFKAHAETSKIKGHYLNVNVGTCEEMIKRVIFAKELGILIVMHDYLIGGIH